MRCLIDIRRQMHMQSIAHMVNQRREHAIRCLRFTLEIAKYITLAGRRHDIHHDGPRLSISPTASNRLVILLITMRGKDTQMCAMLEVEPKPGDPWFRN